MNKRVSHVRNLSGITSTVKSLKRDSIRNNQINFADIVGDINYIQDQGVAQNDVGRRQTTMIKKSKPILTGQQETKDNQSSISKDKSSIVSSDKAKFLNSNTQTSQQSQQKPGTRKLKLSKFLQSQASLDTTPLEQNLSAVVDDNQSQQKSSQLIHGSNLQDQTDPNSCQFASSTSQRLKMFLN